MAAWFLGIIVPVYHHVGLHAALVNQSTNNIVERIHWVFDSLPWIDWVYLALMFALGGILILSGFVSRPFGALANHPPQRTAAAPRGFEVITDSESGAGRLSGSRYASRATRLPAAAGARSASSFYAARGKALHPRPAALPSQRSPSPKPSCGPERCNGTRRSSGRRSCWPAASFCSRWRYEFRRLGAGGRHNPPLRWTGALVRRWRSDVRPGQSMADTLGDRGESPVRRLRLAQHAGTILLGKGRWTRRAAASGLDRRRACWPRDTAGALLAWETAARQRDPVVADG
jgi:hypothetical protein